MRKKVVILFYQIAFFAQQKQLVKDIENDIEKNNNNNKIAVQQQVS